MQAKITLITYYFSHLKPLSGNKFIIIAINF